MVFEKVRSIVAKTLGVEESKITLETSLVNDLGADSIDAVEIIMELEDEFGIEFDDEATQTVQKISDIVEYIENHKN